MTPTVALIGNPNSGKSSLFNRLTGVDQHVGNWAGVTVERKDGRYRHAGREVVVVDLPGVYALDRVGDDIGVDARIALEYLLGGEADLVVDVVDVSNLERNLYLTAQLVELGLPVVLVLTMGDVAAARERPVDAAALGERLGCPVVAVDPRRGRGTTRVRDAIEEALAHGTAPVTLRYPAPVEDAIWAVRTAAPEVSRQHALALLSGDAEPPEALAPAVGGPRTTLAAALDDDVDIVLADARYGFVHDLVAAVTHRAGRVSASATDRVDAVVLNRWLGIPLFLAAMYVLFMLTINVGGAFVDFFDILAGAVFVDGARSLLGGVGAPEWVRVVVADGAGGGVQTVATFIPIVGALFLCLSLLEDSGYMARAAFVMDRVMRVVGLPGRAFVPLLLGFGCNVPAVLATRALESRRDRHLAILMNPFMSCGARLPVYALFAAVFFPAAGQNVVFALYLVGMAAAVLTGLAVRSTLLRGDPAPFVMELPPYRLPAARNLLRHTGERLRGFTLGAGKVIVSMVVVLTVLGSVTAHGTIARDGDASLLDTAARAVTPAFAPLGIEEDNWPATVGIATGLFAKEAVVGTLDSLYGSLAAPGSAAAATPSPWSQAGEAVRSVGTNLRDLAGRALDPLGISVAGAGAADVAAAQGVGAGTLTEMTQRFDGGAGAFAYLLFVLLYAPCAAATGAIYRETTLGWTAFAVAWTTGLAFVVSTVAYQAATFGRHPGSSAAWIAAALGSLAAALVSMRVAGGRRERSSPGLVGGAALPAGAGGKGHCCP